MSGHLERLEAFCAGWEAHDTAHGCRSGYVTASPSPDHPHGVSLDATDLRAAVDELKQARAQLAEGSQRDRALALLLLRSGGQVEFSHAERVSAPSHGQLISYPNLATGGLVLAYSEDGETIGAAPQQPAPEPCDGDCDCDCQPGQPCLCPERDCYCGPCPVCGPVPQQPAPDGGGAT